MKISTLFKIFLYVLPWLGIIGVTMYYGSKIWEFTFRYNLIESRTSRTPGYLGRPYWEYYNEEVADINSILIKELETTQRKFLDDFESKGGARRSCLQCFKEAHFEFMLMSIPALREDEALRKQVVKLHVKGEQHAATCQRKPFKIKPITVESGGKPAPGVKSDAAPVAPSAKADEARVDTSPRPKTIEQ